MSFNNCFHVGIMHAVFGFGRGDLVELFIMSVILILFVYLLHG